MEHEKYQALEEENKRLKSEGVEKDKRIKEFSARLDAIRKQRGGNITGIDSAVLTQNTSIADVSLFEQFG